eukprot:COSAG01_NODE_26351_length_716_cov_13.074554_1_plen_35_part_01
MEALVEDGILRLGHPLTDAIPVMLDHSSPTLDSRT